MFCSLHLAVYTFLLESRAEIINVTYRMDSAIAPDRRVDLSSVLVAKVIYSGLPVILLCIVK